jgi:hypothetical protein
MALTADVVRTLRLASARPIRFTVGGAHVRPADLGLIADRVESGVISVRHNPSLGRVAYYYPTRNLLECPRPRILTLDQQGNVVHEAIHAVFDMRKAKQMRALTNEACGYIAEVIFKLGFAGESSLVGYDDPLLAEITQQAKLLALQVIERPGRTFADTALHPLRSAIRAHPVYSRLEWTTLSPENNGLSSGPRRPGC